MEQRVLDMERYIAAARQAAAEGCVLLENRDGALPIQAGTHMAVFGRSAFHYYKSGEGSGGLVNAPYVVGILDALKRCGDIQVDQPLLALYEAWLQDHPYVEGDGWGMTPWSQEEMTVTPEMLEAAKRADISLIIIGRTAGEDQDNRNVPGSYLLTGEEERLIREVCAVSHRTAVVLNVGNIIDMRWVEKYRPQAVLYVWQGGQEGGNGVLDVLLGKVAPCGKLTDTIARTPEDYPAAANFGDPHRVVYQEDIYVGYRYFETFAKDRVLYPFGYGMSYTGFTISAEHPSVSEREIQLSVCVQNVGSCSGKEVVQIYGEAPQGALGKPARQLIAFRKTAVLQPGETQKISFSIPKAILASYDDTGAAGHRSCYVLEEGDYRLYVGGDVRRAQCVGSFFQPFTLVERLQPVCPTQEPFRRMRPVAGSQDGGYRLGYEEVPVGSDNLRTREPVAEIPYTGDRGYRLVDVLEGRISMETFIAQLSDEDLICLFRGEGMCSPLGIPGVAAAFGGVTERLRAFGVPVASCADGPSGIRFDSGICAFSLPSGTLLGCTFNEELVGELFAQVGAELWEDRVDTLLGPGMNIHRHPLNGRNFEYISEDPLLTGKIAAAQTRAMGTGTIKHFAANNQEVGRSSVSCIISERALREIYLKGFEIAVKEGAVRSVMTAYGAINGIWAAGNYDLCTQILRREWGFTGVVMTDWWAKANYPGQAPIPYAKAPMAAAQNDLYMCTPCVEENPDADDVAERLAEGWLTRGELQRNAGNILRFLLESQGLLRLAGRAGTAADPVYTMPASVGSIAAEKCYPIGECTRSIVIGGADLHPRRGQADIFDIQAAVPGQCRISITASAPMTALAQLPVSFYCDNVLRTMLVMQGTEGAVAECSTVLGQIGSGRHSIGVFYGSSGLEIKKMTVQWE